MIATYIVIYLLLYIITGYTFREIKLSVLERPVQSYNVLTLGGECRVSVVLCASEQTDRQTIGAKGSTQQKLCQKILYMQDHVSTACVVVYHTTYEM